MNTWTKTGKWVEKEFGGTVYINLGNTKKPTYHFTTENGYVTEVYMAIEIKNNKDWLHSYNSHLILGSLAFAGAQDEMSLFSKLPSRIIEQIHNNTFKSFHFREAGITFSCEIEYSGYRDMQSFLLIPMENAVETYFSLNFSMNKQK